VPNLAKESRTGLELSFSEKYIKMDKCQNNEFRAFAENN